MEPGSSEETPISPKKKLKPSTSFNSDMSTPSDSLISESSSSDVADSPVHLFNGLAPTRSGRGISASSANDAVSQSCESECINTSSQSMDRGDTNLNPQNRESQPRNMGPSIQEEEVSSSENSVIKSTIPTYQEGEADSLTNGEPDEGASITEATAKSEKEQ